MCKVRFVGLDVHEESITMAVVDQDGSAPQVVAAVPHETRALLKQLKKLGTNGQLRC
jgi:RNase H-fold protein (predicted Holliday junction resolvase)